MMEKLLIVEQFVWKVAQDSDGSDIISFHKMHKSMVPVSQKTRGCLGAMEPYVLVSWSETHLLFPVGYRALDYR